MIQYLFSIMFTLILETCASDPVDFSVLNPMKNPKRCGFDRSSYICDPDSVMDKKQAAHLNFLAADLTSTTACICSNCPSTKTGVTIGIFITSNLSHFAVNHNETQKAVSAKQLRKEWKLGTCDDDIAILVIVSPRQFEFDMGATVDHLIHNNIAEKIFHDCSVHFENNNFYQGLESMINSYRDILGQLEHAKQQLPATKTIGFIVGVSTGIVVLFLLMVTAAIIRYRQLSQPLLSLQNSRYRSDIMESSKFEYKLCDNNYKDNDCNNSSSSDEGIDSDDEKSYDTKLDNSRYEDLRPKRQLSAVVEEENEDSEVISLVVMNNYKNEQVTEL